MAGISISGLVSGTFDWKAVVDQLIQIESAPIARLQTEESANIDRLASFAALETRLADLKAASTALAAPGLFGGRTASSGTASSDWTMSAATDAPTGSHTIAVSQLATASRRNGASGISAPLSASDDVSGLTLATMPTATAITAGNFTINGRQVAVELTDSLQDVFDKISTATDGVVTASYSSATDKITFASNDDSEIVLGAANDSTNFLVATRLGNNGTDSISSSATLGTASQAVPLADSRLEGIGGIAATGTFTINGVEIDYDLAVDSLSTLMTRINDSAAGVTASYDSTLDRMVLVNDSTGDVGLGTAEGSSGLLDVLGLGGASTLVRGKNTLFTVDGGATLSSLSTTLDSSAHGIAGLSVTVNSASTQNVTVKADTASMNSAISNFITKFNTVQSYIESQTKVTVGVDGKVNAALLADNREVQGWASEMRRIAFGELSGVAGTVKRLEHLGIDFSSIDSTLRIRDQSKLDAALASKSGDVAAFFNTTGAGFAATFEGYLTPKLDTSNGALKLQMDTLNKQNASIDAQIATLNARLANQRELLTASFLAMQNAQSVAQQQQQQLTNMFASKNDKN
jgi:flagellar hook-associated protein 2